MAHFTANISMLFSLRIQPALAPQGAVTVAQGHITGKARGDAFHR